VKLRQGIRVVERGIVNVRQRLEDVNHPISTKRTTTGVIANISAGEARFRAHGPYLRVRNALARL
jgi:hypothetical protein